MVFKTIGRHPQIIVAIFILGVFGLFIFGSRYYIEQTRQALAYQTAQAFEISITTLHQFYSKEIVPRARAGGIELTDDLQAAENKIPFPATMTINYGERLELMSAGMTTTMYSAYPFPRRKDRRLDPFQLAALNFLRENPGENYFRFTEVAEREVIRYARGIIMSQDCIECHNTAGIGRQWKVGNFRGVREVVIDLPRADIIEAEMTKVAVLLAITAAIFGGLLMLPTVGILQSSSKVNKTLAAELSEQNTVLEKADLAKSRLMKGVGHDLKTPLNAIIGFSDTMKQEIFGKHGNDKYKDYSESIHTSGLHLLKIIEQLLSTGVIQGSGWSYEEEEIAINPMLNSIEPILRSTVEKAGIEFKVQDLQYDLTLLGDGRAIRQILTNLVDNAVKYSNAKLIKVGFVEKGGKLILTVSDDGTGISEQDLTRLREEHYRGVTSSQKTPAGMGIGLWLVDNFAKMHRAELVIDSTLGKGSSFSVHFPPDRII